MADRGVGGTKPLEQQKGTAVYDWNGVKITLTVDRIIILPTGERLPDGSTLNVSRKTINVKDKNYHLSFSNGAIVKNVPIYNRDKVATKVYTQTDYATGNPIRKPGTPTRSGDDRRQPVPVSIPTAKKAVPALLPATGGAGAAPAGPGGFPQTGTASLNSFINAIVQGESGGNYKAVSPQTKSGRSYGKYQILESNIPAWGREAGIQNLTVAQFMASPAIQDKVATAKLTTYYNKFGAAGAASAWFTGSATKYKTNPSVSDGYTTAAEYVNRVLKRMGTASTASPSTGGGAGAQPAAVGGYAPGAPGSVPGAGIPAGVTGVDPASMLGPDGKVDPQKAIEAFGYIAELAKSVPDIQKVLTQAVQNGWTPARFTAAIQETPWYKTTSQAQRQNELLKKTNPGEYRRQRQQTIDKMVIVARNLGVEEGNQRIFILAEKAMAMGWSDQEIQRYLAADVKVAAKGNKGATAVTVDSLKQQAADYAVPLSDATLQMWTTQILRGMVPAESFNSYLKEQAKSLFPGLSKAIDAGVTVAQYTDPYKQIIAQTLELNANDVQINDPRIQKALFAQTKDGQRTSMNLSDYREYLRGLPEYGKTRQAQEQAAGFTERITQLFGKTSA